MPHTVSLPKLLLLQGTCGALMRSTALTSGTALGNTSSCSAAPPPNIIHAWCHSKFEAKLLLFNKDQTLLTTRPRLGCESSCLHCWPELVKKMRAYLTCSCCVLCSIQCWTSRRPGGPVRGRNTNITLELVCACALLSLFHILLLAYLLSCADKVDV
jgi:hypothetical protein